MEFHWKRARRSLTVPLRGISLLSEATEMTIFVSEVFWRVVVVTGGEVRVGLVTGGGVGVVTEREVGVVMEEVVELVTGGEVGVVMGRGVGLMMEGDLEMGSVAEEVGLLVTGEVGRVGLVTVGVREEGDNGGFSISPEARFSSRALTRFFLFCTEHTQQCKISMKRALMC